MCDVNPLNSVQGEVYHVSEEFYSCGKGAVVWCRGNPGTLLKVYSYFFLSLYEPGAGNRKDAAKLLKS
jgi:hypothetical protein